MCKCRPNVRTPWCGRPGCQMPKLEKEERKDFCEWRENNYMFSIESKYNTSCDNFLYLEFHDYKYCPYCGKQIKEV